LASGKKTVPRSFESQGLANSGFSARILRAHGADSKILKTAEAKFVTLI